MPKKDPALVPAIYRTCLHDSCALAPTCLRHIAYASHLMKSDSLIIINPANCTPAASANDTPACAYYRSNTPVSFARGFISFQRAMLPGQYEQFRKTLIRKFSRPTFYAQRNGTVAITPSEQKFIAQAAIQAGLDTPPAFDNYEMLPDWYE